MRTDGTITTLAVKEVVENSVDGTHEWETTVDDFETTHELLQKIGLKPHGYQENRRAEYEIYGVQVCIDEWPKIPPYLELESTDENKIYAIAEKLGLKKEEMIALNNQDIYLHYGIKLEEIPELKFANK